MARYDFRVPTGYLQQDLPDLRRIAAVSDPDWHPDPPRQIMQHPVNHLTGDKLGIRHNYIGQITRLEEDKIQAYFGGGYMYATAERGEPWI